MLAGGAEGRPPEPASGDRSPGAIPAPGGLPFSRRWRRCATPSLTSRSPRSASWRRAPSPRPGTRGPAAAAHVLLRAQFCLPDGRRRLRRGVGRAGRAPREVVLEDHFASEAINSGVAARAGFARSFDGDAVGELHELRAEFLRKAVMAGTDQVCRPLLAAGTGPAALAAMTLGELPPSRELDRLRQRRAELGLPAGDDAPLLIEPVTGAPVGDDAVPLHLGAPGRRGSASRRTPASAAACCGTGTTPKD